MPNWTKNVITAPKEVLDMLIDDTGEVDFNRVVPMPDAMDVGAIPWEVESAARAVIEARDKHAFTKSTTNLSPKERQLCQRYIDNYHEHGAMNWLDWRCKHWGTKWNAHFSYRFSDEKLFIETAWSVPVGLIFALAAKAGEPVLVEWTNEGDLYDTLYHARVFPDGGHEESEIDNFGVETWKAMAGRTRTPEKSEEHERWPAGNQSIRCILNIPPDLDELPF